MTTTIDRIQAVRAAFTAYEAETDRAREDETRELEDLLGAVDTLIDEENPRAAGFLPRIIIRQEHASERLRSVRADSAWRMARAFNELKDGLREASA
jgi:hypothetical protein